MSRKRLRRGIIPDGLVQSRITFFVRGGGLLMQENLELCSDSSNRAVNLRIEKRKLENQSEGPANLRKQIRLCSTDT